MLEIEDASVISVFLMDLIYTYITRTPILIIWNIYCLIFSRSYYLRLFNDVPLITLGSKYDVMSLILCCYCVENI